MRLKKSSSCFVASVFFCFCTNLLKLNIKYGSKIKLCWKESAGLFIRCYSIVDRLLIDIYLINLEEDCC